jgi:hypothetical protein
VIQMFGFTADRIAEEARAQAKRGK